MNILHVIEDFSILSGGLRTVIKDLNNHLNGLSNFNSFIISSRKEDKDEVYTIESSVGRPWLYSKEWKSEIESIIKNNSIDILHIHGVWLYPQLIATNIAIKNKIPFVLTPHGMFEPWLWTKGTLKKKAYFNFISKNKLSKANVIHAITINEKQNLLKFFPNNNVIEIPNLIDFNDYNINEKRNTESGYILYLGRLHEIKGIELLIRSFAKLNNKDILLKIAGGFNEYKNILEELAISLGVRDRIIFLGLVKGNKKLILFKDSFVTVVPSFSEVIGMVNLEAATQKTPVITTYQTGLKREWNENGGVLINPIENELIEALNNMLKLTNIERDNRGNKLYNFVKENYSWELRISDWIQLYETEIFSK